MLSPLLPVILFNAAYFMVWCVVVCGTVRWCVGIKRIISIPSCCLGVGYPSVCVYLSSEEYVPHTIAHNIHTDAAFTEDNSQRQLQYMHIWYCLKRFYWQALYDTADWVLNLTYNLWCNYNSGVYILCIWTAWGWPRNWLKRVSTYV
jgi:hypothetical protein